LGSIEGPDRDGAVPDGEQEPGRCRAFRERRHGWRRGRGSAGAGPRGEGSRVGSGRRQGRPQPRSRRHPDGRRLEGRASARQDSALMGVSVPSEVTAEGQPAPPIRSFVDSIRSALAPVTERLRYLEIDTRMLGMLLALVIIWVGFGIVSGGTFLTPRNLWNLSVQSASIAIMATGMVLVIVSRNIDLSVGSLLGFLGYTMAMVQSVWIPQ